MASRIATFAVVALAAAWLVPAASAQESDREKSRALPNLRERLEQFRNDLVGEAPPARTNKPGQSKAKSATQSRNAATPQPREAASAQTKGKATTMGAPATPQMTPGENNSAVSTPPRLEVQSARKAQPDFSLGDPESRGPRPPQRAAKKMPLIEERAPKKTVESPKRVVPKPAQPESDQPGEDDERGADSKEGELKKLSPADPVRSKPHRSADNRAGRPEPEDRPTAKSGRSADGPGVLFMSESPALTIEVAGPRRVTIGKQAEFIVKVFNAGAAANDVTVSVNIPNYAEVVSAQASVGAAQTPLQDRPEPLQWRISRLEAKGTESLTLLLVPRKSAPLDLGVQWTYVPESSQAMVEVEEPKLVMTISGPNEVLYGESKVYKLAVSNPGNGDTENVMVGLLPIGGAGDSVANHRVGTLRAGESKTIDIELTARQAGAITIKAQAFADGGLRSEAAEQVLVRRASLLIDVEAPKVKYAGTVGTYHLKVINAGNATADNVQVAAMLPPDAKFVSSTGGGRLDAQQGKVKWTLGSLQAGAERRLEMNCSLTAPGDNRVQFVTSADDDLNAVAMASTRVDAMADLKLEVRDPQGPIAVGEDTMYEVVIRNRGTKAAEGIDLTVFFSEGLEATSVEGGPHDVGSGQVNFKSIAMLGAGETANFRVHARADRGGNHVFRAEVSCPSLNTKLATEETTHFYGDDRKTSSTTAAPADDEPQAIPVQSESGAPRDRYSNQ